jgi:hypothetical protein
MDHHSLVKLLHFESDEIFTKFNKASLQGMGTPQEIADFREGVLTVFLRRYFPFPHRIAKGIITDRNGNRSASVDSIIINPVHPYTIDVGGKFSVILADGVDVAIELKPDVSDKGELLTALKQAQTVKKLRRVKGPLLLKRELTDEEIELSKQIPAFVFAIKAKADISNTIREMIEYYRTEGITKIEQVDFLVVLGRGIVINHKIKDKSFIKNDEGKNITGFTYHQFDNDTLAAFLFYLNSVHHATATFHGNILPLYLNDVKFSNVKLFTD